MLTKQKILIVTCIIVLVFAFLYVFLSRTKSNYLGTTVLPPDVFNNTGTAQNIYSVLYNPPYDANAPDYLSGQDGGWIHLLNPLWNQWPNLPLLPPVSSPLSISLRFNFFAKNDTWFMLTVWAISVQDMGTVINKNNLFIGDPDRTGWIQLYALDPQLANQTNTGDNDTSGGGPFEDYEINCNNNACSRENQFIIQFPPLPPNLLNGCYLDFAVKIINGTPVWDQ